MRTIRGVFQWSKLPLSVHFQYILWNKVMIIKNNTTSFFTPLIGTPVLTLVLKTHLHIIVWCWLWYFRWQCIVYDVHYILYILHRIYTCLYSVHVLYQRRYIMLYVTWKGIKIHQNECQIHLIFRTIFYPTKISLNCYIF